jgi:DHA2 family multidrug resistance protein
VGAILLTWSPPPRIDHRLFVIGGLGLAVYGCWQMLGYSSLMDGCPVIFAGAAQGAGLGILMAALARSAFSTLDAKFRSEGTMFFNLSRLYGSTIGIAVVQIFLFNNTQSMHLALAKNLRPYRLAGGSVSVQGLAMMNDLVTSQAAIVAVIDQFKILLIAMLVVTPLALFLRKPRPAK